MTPGYAVAIVERFNDEVLWRRRWTDLLDDSRSSTVFLTWEWLSSWVEAFGDQTWEPFVLAVHRGKELVGLAPWGIRPRRFGPTAVRQVEALGAPEAGSDYLDVIARRGREREVASCLYEFLFREPASRWDTLLLRDIPADSLVLAHVLERLEEAGKFFSVRPGAVCPVLTLPATEAAFMAGLSANRRQQLLRHRRLLEREGAVEHVIVPISPGEGGLERFFALYGKARNGTHDGRLLPFLQCYVTRSDGEPRVQVDYLTVAGRDAAALLLLRHEDALLMYLVAVDRTCSHRVSLGHLLIGSSLGGAIASGISTFDFLKGNEAYKFHWARGARRSLELRCYQRRAVPVLAAVTASVREIGKLLLR
jgi:CelD/BcsL family acetyltransferase involved in cellulose biosynthesis